MKTLVFALLLLTWSSPSLAAGLTLTIQNGLVTLDAQDVTVRQILTEWARVGKTRIINVERITGGPITLKVDAMPERQALDIVLRTIPGYLAMPRISPIADGSLYDSIMIMPTTTAVAPLRPQQPAAGFRPGMQSAAPGAPGGMTTQLRPNPPASLSPGTLPEPDNSADQADDPAIAAAAAAGLTPVPAFIPGSAPASSAPLAPPGTASQPSTPQPAPGTGSPTNPFNVTVGTSQPSLPLPVPAVQPPPAQRVRPPQADR